MPSSSSETTVPKEGPPITTTTTTTTTKGNTTEPDNVQCPRCESTNTKFCYYNNYNLSQPRYFCKACRRYWTRGGTLRNIPVGGGSRKNSSNSKPSKRYRTATATTATPPPLPPTTSFYTAKGSEPPSPLICNLNVNHASSFMSLLIADDDHKDLTTTAAVGPSLEQSDIGLGLGFGFGFGDGYDCGYGYGSSVDNNQFTTGSDGSSGSVTDGGDFLAWSDLAISTPGKQWE